MTEVSEGRTYFCTAGGGLEKILAEEVKSKLGAEDVSLSSFILSAYGSSSASGLFISFPKSSDIF